MEAAYGIGVKNRYALFLEDDNDSADPYSYMATGANVSSVGHQQHDGPEPKKGSSMATHSSSTSSKSNSGLSTAKSTGSHHQQTTNKSANQQQQASNKQQQSSALSESKQNVMANQKSDGRPNRSRPGQQRSGPGGNRENQENRNQQRSPRNNFETKDGAGDQNDFKTSKELRGEKVDNRRNGFTRGGPRGGGRGGGGGGRFPKREFNRHSGSDRTSVKSTEKREGGGSHNWGKIDDFSEQPAEGDDLINGDKSMLNDNEKTSDEQAPNESGDTGGPDSEQTETEPKNDEPQFKTLDEYKRELEEKRVHTQFNIRKPGEGEDKSKWKKTYVLKKKPVAEEEEVEYEEIEVEEETNKRRNRQVLDIEVNFRPAEGGREVVRRGRGTGRGGSGAGGRRNDSDRVGGGGGRGAGGNVERERGGPGSGPRSGGPPRGGGRGRDRNRFQPAPKFDDLNDFPSLSSKNGNEAGMTTATTTKYNK